jgi:DNA-binding transcriptional regulator YiaG
MTKTNRAKKATSTMVTNSARATAVRKAKGNYKSVTASNEMAPGEVLEMGKFAERFGTTVQEVMKWRRSGLKVCKPNAKKVLIRQEDFSAWLATIAASEQ